uniref:Methylmalonyl-CoA mutase C-terminal domain-containing protein n=1 Tax=Candidatus Kentrum sp. SD TaxID=2126332 RepID=A0A451BIC9_9GAMM|nr:MAG: methylmalonyl-CoA mutase C-terminal domain-containing protein [Candidatus Kentron sp. SD]
MASGRVATWSRWFPFHPKVKVGALFEMPDKVVRQAVENDAHVIGRGAKDPGHKTLLPVRIPTNVTADSAHRDRSPALSATGV